jgi:hypothetical protein
MNLKKLPQSRMANGQTAVHIGMCAGTSAAADHVIALLAAQDIDPVIEGSGAYDIAVPKRDAKKAWEILSSDPLAAHFEVSVYRA